MPTIEQVRAAAEPKIPTRRVQISHRPVDTGKRRECYTTNPAASLELEPHDDGMVEGAETDVVHRSP